MPAMLAVAISFIPLGASAGEPSASAYGHMPSEMVQKLGLTPAQQQAWSQIMTQTHQQLDQLHASARARILGVLTPAHRALLSQVAGALATSVNPDRDAAARQLDAALSPPEAQAVLSAHATAKQQMDALMAASRQKFESILTQQQRAMLESGHEGMHEKMGGPMGEHMEKNERPLTAGQVLLHFASGSGMPEMEWHHG